jgi:uncharacterized protein YkwD
LATAAALGCVALGTLAAAAGAAPLTLQVVNTRGVEQASLVTSSSGTLPTNGHGRLVLDLAPGEQIAVTRGDAAPEGASGVVYTVPSAVPAGPVTATLPALPDAVDPAHDSAETWLLARVNDARAALGRAPLRQSGSLNRAADAYAHLLATGHFSHFALADPGVRAVDQGWPFPGGGSIGEVLALAPSNQTALGAWMESPGHWTLLMSPEATVTGIARAGNRWVMSPSNCGPTDAPERCEIGESEVPPRPTPPPGTMTGEGPGSEAGEKRARLRVRLRQRGHRLVVNVRLLEGRGRLRVSVRQGDRQAPLRRHRIGNLLQTTAILPRGGRWKVTVGFEGGRGWADRRLAPRWVRVSGSAGKPV